MTKDNEDQSMEEILQSIKRIIADEDEPETEEVKAEEAAAEEPAVEEAAPEPKPEPEVAVEPKAEPEPEPAKEEVLELTEIVEEGTPPEPEGEVELVAEDKPEPKAEPAPEPKPSAAKDPVDSLLSNDAAQAASQALKSIPSKPSAGGGLGFRNGTTVEDLVLEAMKPMLKDWLDANLPDLVERLVEKEIKKLSN